MPEDAAGQIATIDSAIFAERTGYTDPMSGPWSGLVVLLVSGCGGARSVVMDASPGSDSVVPADSAIPADSAVPADASSSDATTVDGVPIDAAPSALAITPATQDFGNVGIGHLGVTATFTISMQGGLASTGTLSTTITGASSQYMKGLDSCDGATLTTGGSCSMRITFAPTGPGTTAATLVVSDGLHAATATLAGTGITVDDIAVFSPPSVDLGAWALGTTSGVFTFVVSSWAGITLGQPTVGIGGTDPTEFSIVHTTCVAPLDPVGACTIDVQFTPAGIGMRAAILTYASSPGGSTSAVLRGTGLMPDGLAISPASKDFGSVGDDTSSAPTTFTVTNTGTATTAALVAVLGGPTPSGFAVDSSTCSAPLAPSESCSVVARFAPISSYSYTAALNVGGATAALRGASGGPASLTVNPVEYAFGDTSVGATSASMSLTVTNASAAGTGPITTGLYGDSAQFPIVSNSCTVLSPTETCTIVARFAPTAAGARHVNIYLSATPGGVSRIGLSGLATSP